MSPPRFHPETIALCLDLILTQCQVGVRSGEYVRIGEKIEVDSLKELEEALKNMPYKRLQETQRQTYRNSKTISHMTCLWYIFSHLLGEWASSVARGMALEVTVTAAPPPTAATPVPSSPPSLPHSVRHVLRGTKRRMVAEQEEEAKGTDENKYGYPPRVIKRVRHPEGGEGTGEGKGGAVVEGRESECLPFDDVTPHRR